MSILSQAFAGKISWSTAATEGESWFSTLISKAPPAVQAAASAGLVDFKQAASDAIGLADGLLGPILSAATGAVEVAANAALTSAIGPLATELTPSVDAGIASITNALHAEVDAVAAQARAKLVSGVSITAALPPPAH